MRLDRVDPLEPLVDNRVIAVPVQRDLIVAPLDRLHLVRAAPEPLGIHVLARHVDGQRLVGVQSSRGLVARVAQLDHQAEFHERTVELRTVAIQHPGLSRDVLAHPVPLDHDLLGTAIDLLGPEAVECARARQPDAVLDAPCLVAPVVVGQQAFGERQSVFGDIQIRAVLHAQMQILDAEHRDKGARRKIDAQPVDLCSIFIHGRRFHKLPPRLVPGQSRTS